MDTILFDLDGTLLPFDQQEFTRAYFRALAAKLALLGYAPEKLVETVWQGSKAMVRNDGSVSNRERFWTAFYDTFGYNEAVEPVADAFYAQEFDGLRRVLRETRDLSAWMAGLRARGFTLVLATNPQFPRVAMETRLRWVGLQAEDFALVTAYENSSFCKPNLAYYRQIFAAIGREPERCLMVGNNVQEDMCAAALGAHVYLVTDYLENPEDADLSAMPHGSFAELQAWLDGLEPSAV